MPKDKTIKRYEDVSLPKQYRAVCPRCKNILYFDFPKDSTGYLEDKVLRQSEHIKYLMGRIKELENGDAKR